MSIFITGMYIFITDLTTVKYFIIQLQETVIYDL